jgi:transposase InsO family protein
VKRLQELCSSTATAKTRWPRRGLPRQQGRRSREHTLRCHLVDFCWWTTARGWTLSETAACLDLLPRTLRRWQHDCRVEHQTLALGRPTARAPRWERQALLEILGELGPRVGVPTLHACCPTLARAELADFLRRYRRVWRHLHQEGWHVLHWTEPGRVWAIDYAEPPLPLDGVYRALLAVRDLASGRQLLWLPVMNPGAEEVVSALTSLFAVLGAPLVLKSDNGSPFSAGRTQALLAAWGVIPLFSPPRTPRYNGAIEAGIGSMKTRSETQAVRHGSPGWWTWDDVEAARAEANATARPRGPSGLTPDESWNTRRPVMSSERRRFRASVQRLRTEEHGDNPTSKEEALSPREEAIVERRAIRRALEEHGYLLYARRRIPLPIRRHKTVRIT